MYQFAFIRYTLNFILGCLAGGMVFSSGVHDEKIPDIVPEKMIIKGDRAFPPYEFINDQVEPDGFNVEITRAILKELDCPYELSLDDWLRVKDELCQGKIDLVMGMVYSNRRARKFKFGAVHSYINLNIVFRKGEIPVTELEGLRNKQVILQKGAITQEIIEEKFPLMI